MDLRDPFLAIRHNNAKAIRQLIDERSPLLHKTRWSGMTLLHRAAELGHNDICTILVKEANINVNIRSARGWHTPLHIALGNGFTETASHLIQLGGNPWIKNKEDETAFDYGSKRGFRTLCDEFREKCRKIEMKESLKRHQRLMAQKIGKSDVNTEKDIHEHRAENETEKEVEDVQNN